MSERLARDPWYSSWFGEEYLALYPDRDERETYFQSIFAREILQPHARRGRIGFLDLACGIGRHAGALDRGDGGVVGLDRSFLLLRAAHRREDRARPGVVCGDVRFLPFAGGAVGAAASLFTAFGAFEDVDDDLAMLREVRRVLAPGGALLTSVVNTQRLLATLVSREERTVAGCRVTIRRRYDPAARAVEKEIEVDEGAGQTWTFRERVRVSRDEELREMHRSAGLPVVASYGDFDGSPFEPRRSPRLILLAVCPLEVR